MSLEFHITRHDGLPGVRLSLSGQFGNVPFDTDAAAEGEARRIARGRFFTIERKAYRRPRDYRGVSLD